MSKRIQIIDDAQIRSSLCKALQAEGYEVVVAAEGRKALDSSVRQTCCCSI